MARRWHLLDQQSKERYETVYQKDMARYEKEIVYQKDMARYEKEMKNYQLSQ